MKEEISKTLLRTLTFLALFTILFGGIYPSFITGILQTFFPNQAQGSLIRDNSTVRGSLLIGQPFSSPHYFWSRPSATEPFPYNAAASQGSNLSTANPVLMETIKKRITSIETAHSSQQQLIPIDLVTASASGLDPHISLASAYYQMSRVAAARELEDTVLYQLINEVAEQRQFGILGEPRVNVLKLNLQLDQIAHGRK